jgi:deferrochelatase/peroxidase EfeB
MTRATTCTPAKSPSDSDKKVIQGLVARNYDRMKAVSYIVLRVKDVPSAKAFIAKCIPRIATVKDDRAESCLNIGFTFQGLSAFLGKEQREALAKKIELQAFVRGAVDRAGLIGDVGLNAPRAWKGGLGEPEKVHVILSVYAEDISLLYEEVEKAVVDSAAGFELISQNPGNELPDGRIHFGYKDNISQPSIVGLRDNGDKQQPTPAGAFVLGYPSQFTGHTYDYDFPAQLGFNGTFAAFRIMKQDVGRFESYLTEHAVGSVSRELVAARLCGRWRDGTALVVSPEAPINDPRNDFEYNGAPDSICPFSSHIRRTNPRDDRVAGLSGRKHPIVRSTIPYGPPYDPANNDYTEGASTYQERGLIGLFLCANLSDQFEFIMKNWVMRGGFNGNLPATDSDPMIGFHAFVQTRGAAYCFMPSKDGLQYLVDLQPQVASTSV